MASQAPFPLMPPKSTELRLMHFDEYVYTGDTSTILYKLVDALCGTTGAGALINQIFLARMAGALETIYFNDLDYIFGKVNFLSRSPAESYPWNPQTDLLTSDQWDIVRVKDAWYRDRIKKFFIAATKGGTMDGIRTCVEAALGVDADLYEVWRYIDNFGLTAELGRASVAPHYAAHNANHDIWRFFLTPGEAEAFIAGRPDPGEWEFRIVTPRNEVVVRPHKAELAPEELRLVRDMLDKMTAVDTIITVDTAGLAVASPIAVNAAAASSTYYEVQRKVTATPALAQLPPPELLPIDLLPTETWLYQAQGDPRLAPYAAFNITSEYSYYYLVGGGKRSPIDSVTYGTLQTDGTVKPENSFQLYDSTGQYGPRQAYDRADSPDNYPGGKYGIHPATAPALNPDGSPYHFPYQTQQDYVVERMAEVLYIGGQADQNGYNLPIQAPSSVPRTFQPDYAIAFFPPARDSTVSASLTRNRVAQGSPEIRDPINFVHT